MTKRELYSFCIGFKNGAMGREKNFSKRFPEEYKDLMSWVFPDGFRFVQKLYHYLNNDPDLVLGICGNCGKRTTFRNMTTGYSEFCSSKCASSADSTREKVRRTCLERFGGENVMCSEEVRERIRQTNLERYGTEWASQTQAVKEKAKQTNLERYGTEWGLQNEAIREKGRQTLLNKYGVENYTQTEEYIARVKQTNLERYGTEWGLQNEDVKKKGQRTSLDRYGVGHPMKSEIIKRRVEDATRRHLGVSHALQSKEVLENMKRRLISRYGVDHNSKIPEVKDAKLRNNRTKYGVDSFAQTEEYREKTKQTNLERYGVPWACMRPEARNCSAVSKVNTEFAKLFNQNGIEYEMEFPLKTYIYDFKVGDVLIEINPTITHNSFIDVFGHEPKTPNYHLLKSKTATENGYHCIHIWDWDDVNKIIFMLKPKQTLYARKLELKEVGKVECNEFLNAYHLQSSCRGQSIRLGLYMNDILTELMTFGKPRYNKHYEYELLRLCSHPDYIVVGGAEKIFKHFVERYAPASVISYCDASKFDGGVYKRLGFELKTTSTPTKHWCNPNNGRHITDSLLRQRGFDQLFNADYGKGTGNEELMLEHKFLPVYDCGQMTYIRMFDL